MTTNATAPVADVRDGVSGERYGTVVIRESELEVFDNRNPDADYTIEFRIPEFTCLCPRSGYPDFATLHIRYVPGPRCVELKALKLYINGFRDQNVFHEDVVCGIARDLIDRLDPNYFELVGDFNVRGNIGTVVTRVYAKDGWKGHVDPWWNGPLAATGR